MRKNYVLIMIVALFAAACSNNKPKEEANMKDPNNPLLAEYSTPFQMPPFDKIKNAHYKPAFEFAMGEKMKEIQAVIDNTEKPSFKNTIEPLFNAGALLQKVKAVFNNLVSANTNDSLMKISEEMEPKFAAQRDEIMMNPKLFEKVKAVFDNKASFNLTPEQTYLLDNFYKSFVMSGALLDKAKQDELKKINQELSSLSVKFDQNLLAETNEFKMVVDKKEDLEGLPEDVIAGAAAEAEKCNMKGKWIFTAKRPSWTPFLQYAKNRELREKLYKGYWMRGDNNNKNDNKQIVVKVMQLRAKKAQLLGYKDYASYKLETRMAKTPEKAHELLNNLWEKSLVATKRDLAELQKIADSEGAKFKIQASDWWYYSEKLRAKKYNLDENEVKPYFKADNVREGVFTVSNKLYGLSFTRLNDVPLPHPDAEAYEVKEADGKHLGVLYLDFFTRDSKQGGAWCDEYQGHHMKDGKEVTPITTVVCNFAPPTKDSPALLSIDDVETVFHEFGHALESLMSKITYTTSYVAQDFVELPSQILEHWAFHKDVLKLYAKHHKTGAVIPDALIAKLNNSSLFNQGFATTEYLAASLLDLAWHSLPVDKQVDANAFEKEFLGKISLMPEILPRYRSTYFGHIMGGYDAGYYGYIWAAVLDCDAFEAFEENGIFDSKTATAFRKNILERDGTDDPVAMYKNFRGRDAKIEPLLKRRGLL